MTVRLVAAAVGSISLVWAAIVLGVFAAHLAVASGLNSVIVPLADYGLWSTADSVTWALGLANASVLALAGWTLCRRPA